MAQTFTRCSVCKQKFGPKLTLWMHSKRDAWCKECSGPVVVDLLLAGRSIDFHCLDATVTVDASQILGSRKGGRHN